MTKTQSDPGILREMSSALRPIALVPLVLWTAMSAGGRAQSTQLTSTSLSTIQRYPTFYHGRTVALVAALEEIDGILRVPIDATRTLIVLPRDGRPPSRAVELRGLLFDVGQLSQDDTRLSASGLRTIVESLSRDRWPARDTLFALTAATWVDEPSLTPPSVRTIALHPQAFDGKSVTVRGRFRAQNLYGDLPAWPRQSQWDFVLQAADAAIWVTGLRPRGRGFDLDPTTRRGAGAWLEAQGTIRFVDGLARLEASTLAASKPESDAPPAAALPPPPALPPPSVIFSAPLNAEADIDPNVVVRVQFSRDMKESSFEGGVKVAYADATAGPAPPFALTYQSGTHAIEIRFKLPLAPGAAVTVSLGAPITASDGTPMAPASITFRTKG
jgi:Big-like domain-containing protein